jgi:MoaA/NifB/PqqE/SkfB family radical SAM enzyme
VLGVPREGGAPLRSLSQHGRALVWGARLLERLPTALHVCARLAERRFRAQAAAGPQRSLHPPGVESDRLSLKLALLRTAERALAERRLSDAALRGFLKVLGRDVLTRHGERSAKERFRAQHGCGPPDFLVISPGHACNLRCEGCYADSGSGREKLDFATLSRIVSEAKALWGARFFVISGGEPLAWRDDGQGVLDLAEQHPDCFFVMYTNATLIDAAVALRMGRLGNLSPGLSVEGLRERTDRRRGPGVFDKVLAAAERLRGAGVAFGISLTAMRDNADEILSDALIELFFEKQGAFYAWVFQYMPIGRAPSLPLMVTPRQRLQLWARMWELIDRRGLFIADFWNSGTVTSGCVAGGRPGGYLHVDWNGAVSPCVFMPYSPVNVREAFARGQSLDDVWAHPFFGSIRAWQREHGYREGGERCGTTTNWLAPCLVRDHHADFLRLAAQHAVEPTEEAAREALADAAYHEGLLGYDSELRHLTQPVWERLYLRPGARRGQ